jgi:polar amino acid transport system substrate-binding protein
MNTHRHARLFGFVASLALLAGCANVATVPDAAQRQALAPSGTLRVGLYPGTPTSIIGTPSSPDVKGVGFELGRQLAQRAGVPFEPVVLPNNAAVFAAAKSGAVDMVLTNATPVRMKELDFSVPVLQVEQGYLVPAGLGDPGARRGRPRRRPGRCQRGQHIRSRAVARAAQRDHGPNGLVEIGHRHARDRQARRVRDQQGHPVRDVGQPARLARAAGTLWPRESRHRHSQGTRGAMPLVNAFVGEAKRNGAVARAVGRAGLRGARVAD